MGRGRRRIVRAETAAGDEPALPGVQEKSSASMLDLAGSPHRVAIDAAHLAGAGGRRIPVLKGSVVSGRDGWQGLVCSDLTASGALATRVGGSKPRPAVCRRMAHGQRTPQAIGNLKDRHRGEFADSLALSPRPRRREPKCPGRGERHPAGELPFTAFPSRGAQRGLRFWRAEFTDGPRDRLPPQ